MSQKTKTLLLTIPGGGFFWEANRLRETLKTGFEMKYVTVDDFHPPNDLPFPAAELHRIHTVTTLSRNSRIQKIKSMLVALVDSYRVLRRTRPDVLVCVGSSMSIPLAVISKLFKIPTYYVESIARVDCLSQTCQIFLNLNLAKNVYVQWPEMQNLHPKVIYAGSVV